MADIFVTRKIPEAGLTLLKEAGHSVVVSDKDGVLSKEELVHALQQKPYEAVLCLLTDHIDAEVMDAAPSAKIFANYAVGFDNIDLAAAKERGAVVTNTPGVLTDAVAEFTFALVLSLVKRIPEADRFARVGKYEGWGPMLLLSPQLSGKTLGLVGAGRIGSRVAEYAHMFGMRTLYHDIKENPDVDKLGIEFRPTLEALLGEADIVSLHVPLLDSTRHLINRDTLAQMKKGAYLINTARGPVVDEAALVEALASRHLAGAALDVFEHEPAIPSSLTNFENVIVTPHIASATEEARNAMSTLAARNILAVLGGEAPPNAVGV